MAITAFLFISQPPPMSPPGWSRCSGVLCCDGIGSRIAGPGIVHDQAGYVAPGMVLPFLNH